MLAKARFWRVLFLLVLAFVACSPLFEAGLFDSHERACAADRVVLLSRAIASGDLYPRWLTTANWGKGCPYFNFYSPGIYLFLAYQHALGIPLVLAMKLTMGLLVFAHGCGMYLWTSRHFEREGAFVAAALFMYAPYQFFDLYTRGALSEYTALALLPFLFLGIDRCVSPSCRRRDVILLGVVTAALVLVHNLSALMAVPFAAIYLACACRMWGVGLSAVPRVAAGAAIGGGLSAFHWLPAAMEGKHLLEFGTVVIRGFFDYRKHFLDPAQLPGLHAMRTPEVTLINVGLVSLACLAASLVVLLRTPSTRRRYGLVTLALGCGGTFLVLSASGAIYRNVPLFPYVQFPWRWMGLATLFLSAAGGWVGEARLFGRPWGRIALQVGLGLALIYTSRVDRWVAKPLPDMEAREKKLLAGGNADGLCAGNVYIPRWASRESFDINPTLSLTASVSQIEVGSSVMSFTSDGSSPENIIVLPWFYFPGWKARLDDRPWDLGPEERGFIRLSVPEGKHRVTVRFGTTGPRIAGWLLACLCAAAAVAWLLIGLARSSIGRPEREPSRERRDRPGNRPGRKRSPGRSA